MIYYHCFEDILVAIYPSAIISKRDLTVSSTFCMVRLPEYSHLIASGSGRCLRIGIGIGIGIGSQFSNSR
jgi:hypothetical protein